MKVGTSPRNQPTAYALLLATGFTLVTPSPSASLQSGVQGVQGVLVERGSERPIRTAAVFLRRGPGEVVSTGLTDQNGFFRLETRAPGRYVLAAEALGYRDLDGEPVDVERGKLSVVEVRLAPQALEIEPLLVTAESRHYHLEMEGFYDRRRYGFGRFFEPEDIESRMPRRISDLMYRVPGAVIREPENGMGGRAVHFRSGRRVTRICWPMVFVNRHLISPGGVSGPPDLPTALDDALSAYDLWAMEVFRSPAEIPADFNGANAGCGVIVLWTRRGGGG